MDAKTLNEKLLDKKYLSEQLKKFLISSIMEKNQTIWHGVKEKHAKEIFENEVLKGRTTQRYFPDGHILVDRDPNYDKKSKWMKGISTSRDIAVSLKFGFIILKMNRDIIRNNFEIIPLNWNSTIQRSNYGFLHNNMKYEKEEFIITSRSNKNTKDIEKEYKKLSEKDKSFFSDFFKYFKKPDSKTLPLSLVDGFYINSLFIDLVEEKDLSFYFEHKLFKGVLDYKYFNKQNTETVNLTNKIIFKDKFKI